MVLSSKVQVWAGQLTNSKNISFSNNLHFLENNDTLPNTFFKSPKNMFIDVKNNNDTITKGNI